MAAVNEVLSGTDQSAEYTPINGVTDAEVESNGKGMIVLKQKVSGGNWVSVTNQTGAFSLNTPDFTIVYSFFSYDLVNDVRVYLGP